MSNKNILVVEDEEDIFELISYNLQKAGFLVVGAASGEEAIRAVQTEAPDLILLDLMLPGIDGFEVCRLLKQNEASRSIPLVMLTAKGEETDIVAGLELGADDYITKPFSPSVLVARLRAILRRIRRKSSASSDNKINHGALLIDPGRHEVMLGGQPLELTNTEFRILYYLASRPGWVFTRAQIVAAIHAENFSITDRTVDVQIVGLRRKMGEHSALIETIRGVGYRFRD